MTAELEPVWRYEIKYGPEGEANYAWLYKDDLFVATMRTHHAFEIVRALSASPAGVVKPQYIGLKGASEIASADLASISSSPTGVKTDKQQDVEDIHKLAVMVGATFKPHEPAGVGVETYTAGQRVTYDSGYWTVDGTITGNVEGWWNVRFDDGSSATVRPSSLRAARSLAAKIKEAKG